VPVLACQATVLSRAWTLEAMPSLSGVRHACLSAGVYEEGTCEVDTGRALGAAYVVSGSVAEIDGR
jgi:hypothetical protein